MLFSNVMVKKDASNVMLKNTTKTAIKSIGSFGETYDDAIMKAVNYYKNSFRGKNGKENKH